MRLRSLSVSARHDSRRLTLLVGAGRMGGALLKGWVAQDIRPVAVVEPRPGRDLANFVRANRIRLFSTIDKVSNLPISACVVALKPQVLRDEAARLRPVADSGALMVSIAAGTSIASLRRTWGRASILRAMPNLPGAIGKGITALYAPRGVSAQKRRLAQSLMRGLGETLWVERETWIDAVTAVSGSGPAYVFLVAEALARAAKQLGLPTSMAERLARATISGAGALLDVDPRQTSALRADVTSPGGTTEAALRVLMTDDALARLMYRAVFAARHRAQELRS